MDSEILKKIENYCSYQERCKKEVVEKLLRLNVEQSEAVSYTHLTLPTNREV